MNKESSKKALNDIVEESQPTVVVEDKKTEPVKVTNQDEDSYDASVILDYDGKPDVFYLEKKDPNYVYRYLNTNASNMRLKTSNLLKHKGGWQIAPKKHLIDVLGIDEKTLSAEGDYRIGNELVLARIPRDLYKKKEAAKVKEANRPMDNVTRKLKEGDSELSGYGHETMRGIVPESKLK